jgi:hypothetical protein
MDETYYSKHRERALFTSKRYYSINKNKINERKRLLRLALGRNIHRKRVFAIPPNVKQIVLNHYGTECKCCGENNARLLTIDHIENNGREHGNTVRRYKGSELYAMLIAQKYPSGIQVLCFNCNIGKRNNKGVCPHKI